MLSRYTPYQALQWAVDNRIDPDILQPAAGLYRSGVDIVGSCEGHVSQRLPFPWIDFPLQSVPVLLDLVSRFPLWGWGCFPLPEDAEDCQEASCYRLMPSLLLPAGGELLDYFYSVLPGGADPARRDLLLRQLPFNQAHLSHWGKQILYQDYQDKAPTLRRLYLQY